jgi:hypothetical protein
VVYPVCPNITSYMIEDNIGGLNKVCNGRKYFLAMVSFKKDGLL